MYAPIVESASSVKQYRIGPYEAAFLENIVAKGPIKYQYMITVFETGADAPFLIVSSEVNDPEPDPDLLKDLGLEPEDPIGIDDQAGSHFLCLFEKRGHRNFGHSNDWGNPEKFEAAALEILSKRLGHVPTVL